MTSRQPETVGFSGTRSTLTSDDRIRVAEIILALPRDTRIVTGACIGLDAFVADYAHAAGYRVHTIVPADRSRVDPVWRLHCTTYDLMPAETSYRDRNQRIVLQCDRLIVIAAHDEMEPESRRSGTWQTARLARKASRKIEVHVLCAECDLERRRQRQERGGPDA